MVVAAERRYTVEDLASFPDDGKRRELVDGRIVEWDVTTLRHGFLTALLVEMLSSFVRQRRLGLIATTDALIRIFGSAYHARGGDIAFFARGRLPENLDAAAADVAPDFVVEVLSPSDQADEVQRKIHDWLQAGVRMLWYVDPATGITAIYRPDGGGVIGPKELLDGGSVLPGFTLRMQDLLDELGAVQHPGRPGQ
jgi:Uma2 family endonuclease